MIGGPALERDKAALPAKDTFTTRAAGQASPYVSVGVGRGHRVTLIALERMRCMHGRLDMMIGIRQKGGSFSVVRRSGMFHVKTGKMLIGEDFRVSGHFTSPTTATGRARVIVVPRLGAKGCDSGWVRFRLAVMNPIGLTISDSPSTFVLPAALTAHLKIVNRSPVASKANRIAIELRARSFGSSPLGSAPKPSVSSAQGHCSISQWRPSEDLEATISCDLGRLRAHQHTSLTISSSFPTGPSACEGIELSLVASLKSATLNEPRFPMPDQEASFQASCP